MWFWRRKSKDATATLFAAAEADDLRPLRAFAEANGQAALRAVADRRGMNILHVAAAAGSTQVVRWLTSAEIAGCDVNATCLNAYTALHAAAANGSAEVCTILLAAGARPDMQTVPQGYAPLHSAAWGGHRGVVEVLLGAGARIDLRNYRGEIPAQTAIRQGHAIIAGFLGDVMGRG